jgi:hypothetical protein
MVLDIAFNILTPDDRVVVIWSKELGNVFCPHINGLKPFLSEDVGQVSMNCNDSGSGDVVTEDPK